MHRQRPQWITPENWVTLSPEIQQQLSNLVAIDPKLTADAQLPRSLARHPHDVATDGPHGDPYPASGVSRDRGVPDNPEPIR